MQYVTTIIPSTCEKARSELIFRAINSALHQNNVHSEVIIVVNGDRYDRELFDSLKNNSRLKVMYLKEGNVSHARFEGIKSVTTDFYGFLDDDDEYFPNALSIRIKEMKDNADTDIVVTNGYLHKDNIDVLLVNEHFKNIIQKDLILSFFETNWFVSAASLFRNRSVDKGMFKFDYKHFEWTYLFFNLISKNKKIKYIDSITYRKNEDNDLSVSKGLEYKLAYPSFLLELYKLPLPNEAKTKIKQKYRMALNANSNYYLNNNNRKEAVRYHVKCLLNGGWSYFPYTRKLFF